MTQSAFQLLRTAAIPSLNIEYQEYRHQTTGARHIHLAADDSNNTFLVAFRTVPKDSTGVAHILEHTALCGSRRFPVRDPFFMMTRRSLSTFMNAFTASDWTAYPFATQSRKDFDNLMDVYLDAAFFPNLDPLDFAQEGHRVEFENPEDPTSNLQFKGIVFNEMKGAMSAPVSRVWQTLQSALFPTNTYHYNSGGEPSEIPNLSYEDLRAFHARHYHPSNAIFMTYGDFPVEDHQQRMEQQVLSQFQQQALDLSIPKEQRFCAPQIINATYPLDEEDIEHKTHILLGWLLGPVDDLDATLDAQMLSSILLDHSGSPLRRALETTKLGTAPSELCGYDDSTRETVFVCGLEGSDPEQADAVEKLILQTLQKVAEQGVDKSELESVLHQLELNQREVGGAHYPYALQLMMKSLTPLLHGGDPVDALNIDPMLERLREKIKDPEYIKQLASKLFLDNPHRVRLTMSPDTGLSRKEAAKETARLNALRSSMDEQSVEQVITQTHTLKQRQESEDDPDLLPCVTLQDVPDDLKISEGITTDSPIQLDSFTEGTNGLVYQQIIVELPELPEELLEYLPLFCDCINEVGIGDKDYLQIQAQQVAVTGGISARLSYRSQVDNSKDIDGFFVLSGKALTRNQRPLTELLRDTLQLARLDELPRLRELIAQIRAHRESSITSQGHRLAMLAASAGLSLQGELTHRWDGLASIQQIIKLDNSLDDTKQLAAFADHLKQIQQALLAADRRFLLVAEKETLPELKQHLEQAWANKTTQSKDHHLAITHSNYRVNQAWITSTQVNFCSRAYPTVAGNHPDAPALTVLGHFLRNGYLHRCIREQGGAYGGGASYTSDGGVFRLYSYRDPRLLETLDDFDASLEWLQDNGHKPQQLEEAILGVIGEIDRPGSPASEAISSFFGSLHGRTPSQRRDFRQQVLHVTIEDLQRVSATYLTKEQANTAIITSSDTLEQITEEHPTQAFECCHLS